MAESIRGVTKENYSKLAVAFMQSNGGKGKLIVRETTMVPGEHGPEKRLGMPKQWAAWRAYFAHMAKPQPAVDAKGYFTAPTEWPHEFDATWTEQQTFDALTWIDRPKREAPIGQLFSAKDVAKEIDRKAIALRARAASAKMRVDVAREMGLGPKPDERAPTIDVDQLFACHAADLQASDERRAAREARLTAPRDRA